MTAPASPAVGRDTHDRLDFDISRRTTPLADFWALDPAPARPLPDARQPHGGGCCDAAPGFLRRG